MVRITLSTLLISIGLICSSVSYASINPDSTENQNFRLQMTQARMKFQNENYHAALRIYRELYVNNPKHGLLNFRIGEAEYKLGEFEHAVKHFLISEESEDKQVNLLYFYIGDCYKELQDFINSEKYLIKYLEVAKKKEAEFYNAKLKLAHVKNAIKLVRKDVHVTITNPGENINSEYVDAIPSINAEQDMLIFTSRRPDLVSDQRDPGNGQYYDDIYISQKDNNGDWTKAILMPNTINSAEHDANTSISPDGSTIYIYKNIKDKTQSGDIYTSIKKNGAWSNPAPLVENKPDKFFPKIAYGVKSLFVGERTINSSYFETSACVTSDNNTLYFVSERTRKGIGSADIWVANRQGKAWSIPKNLGSTINSKYDEVSVFIHPDGKTLFFSSNGENSMGGYDIFMSKKQDNGRWSKPINLGFPINTPKDEYHFVLASDSKTAYISSNRDGGLGEVDIYQIDMENYFDNLDVDFSKPKVMIVKGSVIDEDKNPIQTKVIVKNKNSGKIVSELNTDESGNYLITLDLGEVYIFEVNHKEMQPESTSVDLRMDNPDNKTKSLHFILRNK